MIAANRPVQRPRHAKLLVVDARGCVAHRARSGFADLLQPGDLVIANDAATLPASLHGVHLPSGADVEVRLAGRGSLAADDVHEFVAVVFGAGDFRARTEDRPMPPPLAPGDRLALGPLAATVDALLDHPRLVSLRFDGTPSAIWDGLARHGRPIQYAHVPMPLALWDVWTPIASLPAAFEPPSAGFALDWRSIRAMCERGIAFVTITHAAGISSSGDAELDRRLPFDEPYRIPEATAAAIWRTKAAGGRIVAVGTTSLRLLETAAAETGEVRPFAGETRLFIMPGYRFLVIDALLTNFHLPRSTLLMLVAALAGLERIKAAYAHAVAAGYRFFSYGDACLIERPRW